MPENIPLNDEEIVDVAVLILNIATFPVATGLYECVVNITVYAVGELFVVLNVIL